MRELMTLVAKSKLTEQKMMIEKDELHRDVSNHQRSIAEMESKIQEYENEFNIEYAPDEGNNSQLGFDDDYTNQNMLKEKSVNDDFEIEESSLQLNSQHSSEEEEGELTETVQETDFDQDEKKKELMKMLGKGDKVDHYSESDEEEDDDEEEEFTSEEEEDDESDEGSSDADS